MLFNKDGNGNEELKAVIGWVYKSNDFANIEMDIELAQEELIKIIGQNVFDIADNYYNDIDGSGSGSVSGSEPTVELKIKLLQHIRLPNAILAYLAYADNADLSHEDAGRKVKINKDSESLPWEWMVDRDNASLLRKADKATDRLISFLEKNQDNILAWKNSTSQKLARASFIKSAEAFDKIFPIAQSRTFFLKILPFMNIIERQRIKAVLTSVDYAALKAADIAGTLTAAQLELTEKIQLAIAPLTMSLAVRRLSLQVIPEGVIQNYISEQLTTKAKSAAPLDLINSVARTLEDDGEKELRHIQEYLRKLNDSGSGSFSAQAVMPANDEDNKYFRT